MARVTRATASLGYAPSRRLNWSPSPLPVCERPSSRNEAKHSRNGVGRSMTFIGRLQPCCQRLSSSAHRSTSNDRNFWPLTRNLQADTTNRSCWLPTRYGPRERVCKKRLTYPSRSRLSDGYDGCNLSTMIDDHRAGKNEERSSRGIGTRRGPVDRDTRDVDRLDDRQRAARRRIDGPGRLGFLPEPDGRVSRRRLRHRAGQDRLLHEPRGLHIVVRYVHANPATAETVPEAESSWAAR